MSNHLMSSVNTAIPKYDNRVRATLENGGVYKAKPTNRRLRRLIDKQKRKTK